MSANWNLGQDFLGGVSLAERMAGRQAQQDLERQALGKKTALESAEFAAKYGVSPDDMNQGVQGGAGPSSDAVKQIQDTIAGMRQMQLEEARNKVDLTSNQADEAMQRGDYYRDMGDYISGRNDTAVNVAGIRAGAMKDIANLKLGGKGPFSPQETSAWSALQKAKEMDPDGSLGIFGPNEQALYMDGLQRLKAAGQGGPLPSASAVSPKPQGIFGSIVSGISGLASKIAGQDADPAAPAGSPVVAPGGGTLPAPTGQWRPGGAAAVPAPTGSYLPPGQVIGGTGAPRYKKTGTGPNGEKWGLNADTNSWEKLQQPQQ